jgi:hypothetical protein
MAATGMIPGAKGVGRGVAEEGARRLDGPYHELHLLVLRGATKRTPGVLQLVPREQHDPGSIFQDALHPDGRGGFYKWGK